MSQFPWQPAYGRYSSSEGDEQIEALQTDVMRFMAIIGLCLMAIFSIVQSMPYQSADETPKEELHKLQADIASMHDEIKQLDKVIQQKKQLNQQLTQLEKALNKGLLIKRQALVELDNKQELEEPIKVADQEQGFSLRFSSDQALLALLKQQKISLYFIQDKQVWEINSASTGWSVVKAKQAKQYYQMSEKTVPPVLRELVKNRHAMQPNTQRMWGVVLPVSITETMTQLVKDKQGGALVIEGNGRVVLK